jgi:uncharacterized protein (DUF697 family)
VVHFSCCFSSFTDGIEIIAGVAAAHSRVGSSLFADGMELIPVAVRAAPRAAAGAATAAVTWTWTPWTSPTSGATRDFGLTAETRISGQSLQSLT